jgi:flagellar assembly factor FliW
MFHVLMFYYNYKVKLTSLSRSESKLGFLTEHLQMFFHVPGVLLKLLKIHHSKNVRIFNIQSVACQNNKFVFEHIYEIL